MLIENVNYRRYGKKKVKCLGCHKGFLKMPSKMRKNNFCSLKCRDDYNIGIRYGHLYQIFNKNLNAISYLFGLILGDGNLRKTGKITTRVSIGFDIKYNNLIKIFEKIAKKLKINYFIEPKVHNNCQAIGFVLTNKLLKKYGMLYNGSKYNNQPKPIDKIINNINFIAGLINSDGYCGFSRTKTNKFKKIRFSNTVYSIVESLKKSLEKNKIDYRCYYKDGKFDKRTGNTNKNFWIIDINKKRSINLLINNCIYDLKEFK